MTQVFKLKQKQLNKARELFPNFAIFESHGMELTRITDNEFILTVKWDKLESYDFQWNNDHAQVNRLKWVLFDVLGLKGL